MKHKSLIAGVLLVAFASAAAVTGLVKAQQTGVANGFKVSPVRDVVTVEKGKTINEKVYVTNVNNYTVVARPIVNDFEPSTDESGKPQIILDESQSAPSNSFKSLVKALPDVTLKPGETATITVPITVPSNASSGGYYGAVRFISADNDNATQRNVALSASVGTIFLVRVPGQLTESLQLVDFSAAKGGSTSRIFTNGKDIQILTRLKNTGNIHVAPYGKITVLDRRGNIVEQYEFNNEDPRANILPGSTRKFIDSLKKQNYIGKYTITANLGYGSTGSLITAKNTFWVIPVWVIVVAVVLVLLFIIGGFMIYRRFTMSKKHGVKPRR